jgi:hypothetical protein
MDQVILRKLAAILGKDASNYTVFLQSYEIRSPGALTSAAIIKQALGAGATPDYIDRVDGASVWPIVESCLSYAGDHRAGPSPNTLRSEEFHGLIHALREQIVDAIGESTTVESFELREGHPGYPVFWDFAFLFRKDSATSIFIGSSSD